MNSNDAHTKGEIDSSQGKHERPHSHTEEFFSFGDTLKHVHENNQAYEKGHQNNQQQKK